MNMPFNSRTIAAALVLFVAQATTFAADDKNIGDDPRSASSIGVELEQQNRWKDAVDHYKAAAEKWPKDEALTYGLRRSKIHYGIERRYSDDSFREDLLAQSQHENLELLDTILDRIRESYVENISTSSVVAHGTESLWLALSNEKFVDHNLFGADPQRIQLVKQSLHQTYWNKPVQYREGARQMVLEVAEMCSKQLGLSRNAVILEYVFASMNCLDEYSSVLTPSRYGDLNNNMKGEFVGIGIVMEADAGKGMALINVLPESPASEQGLRSGDHIIGIDTVDCRYMTTDEAAGLLTGASGSTVRLSVLDPKKDTTRNVECIRRRVEVKSIPVARIVDTERGIAYIQMTGFQETTSSEMLMALHQLKRQGMKSLIWDVRGNPGGLLQESARVLDLFITDGKLVTTEGRVADQNSQFTAHASGTWDVPLVLLIDGNSASASEIVAGAVRDHSRGTLIGRKSYGKWSVQSIYPLRSGTGLRLTTAHFFSPNHHRYPEVGISPDITVEWPEDDDFRRPLGDVDPVRDHDVAKAIEVLKSGSSVVTTN